MRLDLQVARFPWVGMSPDQPTFYPRPQAFQFLTLAVYCKRSKAGAGEGLGERGYLHYILRVSARSLTALKCVTPPPYSTSRESRKDLRNELSEQGRTGRASTQLP